MTSKNGIPCPNQKSIGILGGGQLGRMLAQAAGNLGYCTIILDPADHCPAAQFANQQIVADFDDDAALQQLAQACHIITYEFENIPLPSIEILQQHCPVFPDANALKISQERLAEKQYFQSIDLKTTSFLPVSSQAQLAKALEKLGLPAILKTRRMGYDGKGQLQLRLGDNIAQSDEIAALLQSECILEGFVPFECEISVIGARNIKGQTACYDPARNRHVDGMLDSSQVPAKLSQSLINTAQNEAIRLMHELQYVGVLGIEYFVTRDGQLLVNEFAPRVHNSGHWTEAACAISQFEQHIRAITGMELGSTQRHCDCKMHNLVGDDIDQFSQLARRPNTRMTHYGKLETRIGRKMGHYTTIFPKK